MASMILRGAALGLLALIPGMAHATAWTFNMTYASGGFNGPGGPASFTGTLGSSAPAAGDGSYLLNHIAGSGTDGRYAGDALQITGLSAGGNASDTFNPTGTGFSGVIPGNGIAFTVASAGQPLTTYKIFRSVDYVQGVSNPTLYRITEIVTGGFPDIGRLVSFQFAAAPVPEAATWSLLVVGFGFTGGTIRAAKRRRTARAA